jgi:hypothetical protein
MSGNVETTLAHEGNGVLRGGLPHPSGDTGGGDREALCLFSGAVLKQRRRHRTAANIASANHQNAMDHRTLTWKPV